MTTFSANAVHLNCVFDVQSLSAVGEVYVCKAEVSLQETRALEEVTGSHWDDHTNIDVNCLHVQSQSLTYFPEKIKIWFPSLKVLNYENNNMQSLSAADFLPFNDLEYLRLDGNNFVSLDGDLFTYTPRLIFLSLEGNRIQHLGKDLLTSLNDLLHLYLRDNGCVNEFARDDYDRAPVVEFVNKLVYLCPPLEPTTSTITTAATTSSTTTTAPTTKVEPINPPVEQCNCRKKSKPITGSRKWINLSERQFRRNVSQKSGK